MTDIKSTTGMLLDGVFASEAIDSSGEIINIEGMDISTFDEGKGLCNWEHKDSSGDSNGQEIVGKVIYARKIYDADDCLDDRQKMFWSRTKLPFLYGVIRLYDGAGHDGAKAIAASIRDSVANNEPIVVGFSIEGATLSRDGNKLKTTVARLVALTTKSCNKQSVSGVMADPNAPEGFSKNPESAVARKSLVDPLNMRLGGSETEYGVDMLKALSAGSYNGPPSSLTGGAALQVEDRSLKAVAKAAARDWPKGQVKFRAFLKKYLEKSEFNDVSDEFLDHYSDLVESDYYRVKKSTEVIASLKKAGKWQFNKETGMLHLDGKPDVFVDPKKKAAPKEAPTGAAPAPITNNGAPVKPNPKLAGPKFDEKKGVLHLPEGSFQVYIPSRDKPEHRDAFHHIMNDPKVEQFHGYAMSNWLKAHQLFREGRTPPEVAMHSVLLSNMSPNTPVPNQELMYSHLVDSMKQTGESPLTPGWDSMKQDWLNRDQPQKFPDHSPEHWKRLESSLRLKNDSKDTGRKEGDIGGFMMPGNKWDNMTKYAKMHGDLMDLVQRHKGNARTAVAEMMFHKNEQTKWNGRRRLSLAQGKADPGEYPGMSIAGLAPKTARYAMAMMGGGNIQIPDTHFVRNLFGLNRNLDSGSIELIKKAMWNPRNSHILDAVDRYYGKNHDAVQHLLQHPQWGKQFRNPEDAIFPAFWKHWMAIVPHEQARGHQSYGYNELTDHRPYFEAIAPYLKKSEGSGLAMETAKQHAAWQLQYGEQPAMMLYYRYLLPKLLEAGGQREAQTMVRKAQELQIELLAKNDSSPGPIDKAHSAAISADDRAQAALGAGPKANATAIRQADYSAAKRGIEDRPVTYQNRQVKPGLGIHEKTGESFHILGATPTDFHVIPERLNPHGGWSDKDLMRIPKTDNLRVVNFPESVDNPSVVDADKHGLGIYTDKARQLAHGFDFEARSRRQLSSWGITAENGDAYWAKGPQGQHVYVKSTIGSRSGEHPWNEARREAAYYDLAHNFFGLGHMVPTVAAVQHPKTGREYALVEHVPGQDVDELGIDAIRNLPHDQVHKAAIMNLILGNGDRHSGNVRINPNDNRMYLIDHNLWGSPGALNHSPAYLKTFNANDVPIHPEALSWVNSLDQNRLRTELMKHHVPADYVDDAVKRLDYFQKNAATDPSFHESFANAMYDFAASGVKYIPGNDSFPDVSHFSRE